MTGHNTLDHWTFYVLIVGVVVILIYFTLKIVEITEGRLQAQINALEAALLKHTSSRLHQPLEEAARIADGHP